jgi:hypothetical protein
MVDATDTWRAVKTKSAHTAAPAYAIETLAVSPANECRPKTTHSTMVAAFCSA